MNPFVKTFIVLTTALMIEAACFAMDPLEYQKGITARFTAKPSTREEERAKKEIPTTTVTTTLTVPHILFRSEWLYSDPVHRLFVEIAEADIQDFENMLLVSLDWYKALTDTSSNNKKSNIYVKKYLHLIRLNKRENLYTLHTSLHQIKLHRGINPDMDQVPSFFTCIFKHPFAITYLDLSFQYAGKEILPWIGKLPHLRKLNLMSGRLQGDCLEPLSTLDLIYLNLKDNQIDSKSLVHISRHSNLTFLNLAKNPIGPDFLHLQNLSNITFLDLENCLINKTSGKCLQQLTTLRHLNVARCSPEILCFLPQNLLSLDLFRMESVKGKCSLLPTSLTELMLNGVSGRRLGSSDMEDLQKLTHLQKLNLANAVQYSSNLLPLTILTNLQELSLDVDVDNNVLSKIKKDLTNLTSIKMVKCINVMDFR